MDNEELREICYDRVARWIERLIKEHSTPIVLVGVGHDHKSGHLVLLTVEELTNDQIVLFLEAAIDHLRKV